MVKTLKITVEIEYDPDVWYGDSEDGKQWFFEQVLAPENIGIFSNDCGDFIVEKVKSINVEALK